MNLHSSISGFAHQRCETPDASVVIVHHRRAAGFDNMLEVLIGETLTLLGFQSGPAWISSMHTAQARRHEASCRLPHCIQVRTPGAARHDLLDKRRDPHGFHHHGRQGSETRNSVVGRAALGARHQRKTWVTVVEEEAMATRQCCFAACGLCSIEPCRPSRSASQPFASKLSGEARRCEEP